MNLSISLSLGSTRAGPQGPTIVISASSIAENAVVGSTVGVLSVVNGTGTWTFTKTADPDAKFALAGTGGANLNTAAGLDFEAAQSHSVTIQATNGTETISRTFAIGVTNVFEQPSLNALTGTFTLAENSAQGTSAGTLSGRTAGSTLALIDNAGGRVQLSGTTIQAGPTALDFEAATSHSFTVRETLADSANSPRDTTLTLTVTDVVEGGSPPLDFIAYGQSGIMNHANNGTGQPAAHPDTLMWDNTNGGWITPTGNGFRTFLNSMQAATGRVCRLVHGGASGVGTGGLSKGTAPYNQLVARILASGATPSFMLWHQGEGDAVSSSPLPTIPSYRSLVNAIHTDLAADIGRTNANMPLVCSSLGTVSPDWFPVPPVDEGWSIVQAALAGINSSFPHMHYSHSNMDAALFDGGHWDGPSYGRSGARYARTVQALMGLETTRPPWYITAAARFSTTETDLTVVHSMGTDFTPSSGITGFQVSNDNGGTWVPATGARLNATTIRLTHGNLGTVERLVRYQYGEGPDVTAPVKDNGSLQSPLNFTPANLAAPGEVLLPFITYGSAAFSATTNTTQTRTGLAVAGASESVLAIIGHMLPFANMGCTYNSCTVTAQPSGTVIAATLVTKLDPVSATTAPGGAIYQAVLPSGTTSIDVSITLGANPFNPGRFSVSTVPVSRLTSTTAVGTGFQRTASALASTVNIPTSAGGVVFAIGCTANGGTAGTTGAISGTETYTTRNFAVGGGATHAVGDTSGTAASASSAVTATFSNSANLTVMAASWR